MFQAKSNFWRKTIFPNRDAKKFWHFRIRRDPFFRALIKRQDLEKDAFILVTGDTGCGKSNLVGNICFKEGMKHDNIILKDGSKMFVPEDNFIIDPEEFAYKMITKQGVVLWLDEARRSANRRNWYNSIQKSIVDRKNTNRKLFNIYFLCMPYEKEFDTSLASHLTIWIWVKRRGLAEVYCRVSGKKGGSGLNINSIIEREEKWLKENPKKTRVPPTIHPEYIGNYRFAKMNQELNKKYQKLIKEKSAVGDLTDEEKEKYGIEVIKTPEQIIEEAIKKVKDGKIKDKKTLWKELDSIDETTEKKTKMLNFYLQLEGWTTFNRLFDKTKVQKKDIWS